MTVADLIAELQRLPQHHPVFCDVGLRFYEPVSHVDAAGTFDSKRGPVVVINTKADPENGTDYP